MPPLHCEPALEEATSVDGVTGVGAPKDTSSSLLEELAVTIREQPRPALVFVLRIYTIVYE